LDAANAFDGSVVAQLRVSDTAEPMAIERFSTMPPTDDCEGNIAAMALYAGESVASIDRVQPAAAIVRELTEGATTLLRRAGGR
jgi:hypothetical protein